MIVSKRGQNVEAAEVKSEAEAAERKKETAMLEYIAAMDYPEILPEEEEEEVDE